MCGTGIQLEKTSLSDIGRFDIGAPSDKKPGNYSWLIVMLGIVDQPIALKTWILPIDKFPDIILYAFAVVVEGICRSGASQGAPDSMCQISTVCP